MNDYNCSGSGYAVLGTLFLFFMTALGSAAVFFVRKKSTENANGVSERIFAGFASGVMLAASVWSLLTPAMEKAVLQGISPWIPTAGGVFSGALFLLVSERFAENGMAKSGNSLLFLAMTLHNVPEGIAVAMAYMTPVGDNYGAGRFGVALALTIGIGVQNIPEGAAVSLPLLGEGASKKRAFFRGCVSGIVEPLAGIIAILLTETLDSLMPWMLSFAAGAMLYVVAGELIPRAQKTGAKPETLPVGTVSILFGFLLMMILDIALG